MNGLLQTLDHPLHPAWWQIVIVVIVAATVLLAVARVADRLTEKGQLALERWIQAMLIGMLLICEESKQPSSLLASLVALWCSLTAYGAVAATKRAIAKSREFSSN